MLLGPATDMSHRHDFGLTSKPGAATGDQARRVETAKVRLR